MTRRTALLAAIVLVITTAQARPAAAVGDVGPPEEIIAPGCHFTHTTADVTVADDGVPRGFAAFSGGTCGDARVIRYFERGETDWMVVDTPWRGAVLAAAADATGTFLLYQSVDGSLWITRRLADGSVEGGRRISEVNGGGPVDGDLVASGGHWWAVWTERLVDEVKKKQQRGRHVVPKPSGAVGLVQSRTIGTDIAFQRISHPDAAVDSAPTLALRPDGGMTMAWSRRALHGAGSELWVGTVEADSRRRARRFELAPAGHGVSNEAPDVFVQGGTTYLTWQRNGRIVLADNAERTYRARTFLTPGREPRLRASFGRVFVGWTADTNPAGVFMTEREGASWSGAFMSPGTPYEQVLTGVVAAGGLAMVVMTSPTRLYARLQV